MDYLSHNISISKNLNRIRTSRGWSLDDAAEQTGVSKSMLYQIEQGAANPSINVLRNNYESKDNLKIIRYADSRCNDA